MELSPRKINAFLMFKLPSAYVTGVRVKAISEAHCITTLKHRWINQNPFRSVFWAVQGMAAELSTGALVMGAIQASGKNVSMLVVSNKATFTKKARGRVYFECTDGLLIQEAVKKAIGTDAGQTIWVKSEGRDASGDVISVFEFEWTLKLRSKQ